MAVFSHLLEGFSIALSPINLLVAFIGVSIGTLVGMLPGIGPINAIAILIPVTLSLGLPTESILILLAGIYYGSQYGNSISTILINVPGTPSATVTAIDGFAMTKRGQAGPALAMSAIASFAGGTLSVIGLMFFAPLLSRWAIRFGPAEYFALMVFAFTTLSSFAGKSVVKALLATTFGLMLATVGFDPNSAVPRYTFGQLRLLDGMDFVVVTIGLFAISEVLIELEKTGRVGRPERIGRIFAKLSEIVRSAGTMIRGSFVGFIVGILPGAGGTVASFVAYSMEKRFWGGERSGEEVSLGLGNIRGVAAPESANNAAANGAMIPLLTLGVPGSGTTAVLLGALLGLNITPGPLFITNHPQVFWALVASMYVGNIVLLILNLPLVGIFVRVLTVPRWVLLSAVAAIASVGVYAVNRSTFDLVLMAGFGLVGYLMRKMDYPLAPVILGLVLGGLMEKNLRRAMALSGGGWEILVSSPLAIVIWILAGISLCLPAVRQLRKNQSKSSG
jgi:putative tricarboxylic transport membrane protein